MAGSTAFFFGLSAAGLERLETGTLQRIVTEALGGLGFELVGLEWPAAGLLRVTIDFPWPTSDGDARSIGLDECERATRQLQYVFEVEGVDYRRLEVSSPGLDRVLRDERDFVRFLGEPVQLTLKDAIPVHVDGVEVGRRKRFRGALQRAPGNEAGWQLLWEYEKPAQEGRRKGQRKASLPQVLPFELGDVQEVRLAPVMDFKGRSEPRAKLAGKMELHGQ